MENLINIAEILKDCPSGMELDCTLFDTEVLFERITYSNKYPIFVKTKNDCRVDLTAYGQVYSDVDAKCVIFPKGKTSWAGFQRPFRDGDIVCLHIYSLLCDLDTHYIAIFKEIKDGKIVTYANLDAKDNDSYYIGPYNVNRFLCQEHEVVDKRLATEEEKETLFQAIKDAGYKWNAETKTLEGLAKDKFDYSTLIPFYTRILVRDVKTCSWKPAIFGFVNKDKEVCAVGGNYYCCYIPYENNEHLLGTADDCDEYYKTWEK